MTWIKPKVTWIKTDYYSVEDWQRVKDNLTIIAGLLYDYKFTTTPIVLQPMDIIRGTMSLPSVELVNRLESNLTLVYNTFGLQLSEWQPSKNWKTAMDVLYKENPNANDWIRWEMLSKRIKESLDFLDSYEYNIVSGIAISGSERTLQHFSRGR